MRKVTKKSDEANVKKIRPALNPESREKQLIALAVDLAERQLLEGTASSQVITHYLKLGSSKEKLEREKLEEENKLLKAKTEALQSAKRMEGLYEEALDAFRTYSGMGGATDAEDV